MDTRLKKLREAAGLSQKQLADLAEVPLRTLQDYDQGRKDIKGAATATVCRIAQALGCGVESLLYGSKRWVTPEERQKIVSGYKIEFNTQDEFNTYLKKTAKTKEDVFLMLEGNGFKQWTHEIYHADPRIQERYDRLVIEYRRVGIANDYDRISYEFRTEVKGLHSTVGDIKASIRLYPDRIVRDCLYDRYDGYDGRRFESILEFDKNGNVL